ncbi:hypothetical protein HMPREF9162_1113 [Selenomonas sp. oral taxon 137 str. F0430]|nr:hypothetical protein HMPREF9162_1113 [Selenomonas sp. oral taxon 137 str. F0430]
MCLLRTTKTKIKDKLFLRQKKDISFLWRIIIRERQYR